MLKKKEKKNKHKNEMIKAHNTFFSKTGLCTGARSKKKMVSERERNVEHFRRWKLVAKNRSLAVQSRVERSLVDWKSTKHKLVITTVLHWFYTKKKKVHGQLSAIFSALAVIRLRVEIFFFFSDLVVYFLDDFGFPFSGLSLIFLRFLSLVSHSLSTIQ